MISFQHHIQRKANSCVFQSKFKLFYFTAIKVFKESEDRDYDIINFKWEFAMLWQIIINVHRLLRKSWTKKKY